MQNALLNLIIPRSRIDAAFKSTVVLLLVLMTNIGFAELYLGYQPVDLTYHITNTAFVGIPWLVLFILVVNRQSANERHLRHLSQTDGLTGLLNRNQFLKEVKDRTKRGNDGVILMLDADHFKRINDTHGHQAGDECLRHIAKRLCNTLRKGDLAGRLGGEEFAIYLRDVTLEQAQNAGVRLVRPILFRKNEGSEQIAATLSIGAATMPKGADVEHQLSLADRALYAAKTAGRACMAVWDDTAQKAVVPHPLGMLKTVSDREPDPHVPHDGSGVRKRVTVTVGQLM